MLHESDQRESDRSATTATTASERSPADGSSRVDASRIHRLRRWNVVAGIFHAIQGVVMLVLSSNLSLPVSATFATAQPGQPLDASRLDTLFTYRLGPAVAAFSLLSAAFHFLIASPLGFPRYERELRAERNRFRWVEYSLSASLMIVLIAGITGITDVAALIALFGVNASMILFGWLMETTSPAEPASPGHRSSSAASPAVPWIAIAIYIVGAGSGTPTFVYGIFASIFVLFNCFVNQWLQYRARGRWTDYVHGERVYVVLSFVAKTLLAWQIFVNVLV
ncbi:MAG: heliorhodopsin HeR [Ilumatobacteraceae bacterium]